MPPKITEIGTFYRKNPSTGEYENIGEIKDMTSFVDDDRINDNVIDPKEDSWFPEGGTVEFTVKPVEVIDVNAEEMKND